MESEFKRAEEHFTGPHSEKECPVCGHAKCECPDPIGQCVDCKGLIYEGDPYSIDIEGDRWCCACRKEGDA